MKFFRERRVFFYGIETRAEHFHVASAKLIDLVTEPVTFSRSTGRIGFRIEPEEHFFAMITGKGECFSFVRLHGEVGGQISRLQHRRLLLSNQSLNKELNKIEKGRVPTRVSIMPLDCR